MLEDLRNCTSFLYPGMDTKIRILVYSSERYRRIDLLLSHIDGRRWALYNKCIKIFE